MSDGYKNGAFALGLITGIGLSLNLILWLTYEHKREGDETPKPNDNYSGSEIGNIWDWNAGAFISPSDTLAQWIMAAFTVLVALLVWRTLVATQKMAIDQRRIGEAQVKAYLTIENIIAVHHFVDGEKTRFFHFDVRNTVQSPARNVVSYVSGEKSLGATVGDIPAGGMQKCTIRGRVNVDEIHFIEPGGNQIRFTLDATLEFEDAFSGMAPNRAEEIHFVGFGPFTPAAEIPLHFMKSKTKKYQGNDG